MNAVSRKAWVPAWLRPAPDSMIADMNRSGHWGKVHLLNLLWSIWVFLAPVFAPVAASFYWSVGLSYPVFLLLMALIYLRPRREVGYYVFALTVLACVNMPFNVSAWDYGVFACAYVPCFRAGTLWRSALRIALVELALITTAVALQWPGTVMLVVVGVCTTVGAGSLAGRIGRMKVQSERMSMGEVRRLAASAERERIGRDLHDLLGHTLSLITLKLELSRKLFDRDPDNARRELAEAENVARHALAEVRAAVTGIRATGLAGELASARLMLRASGVELEAGDLPRLPDAIDDTLALALRESVTNIHRHAHAARARVSVRIEGGRVVMRVRDDGRGGAEVSGNGLHGMRERVQALSGTLELFSKPGNGTELRIEMPLPTAAAPAPETDSARENWRQVGLHVRASQAGGDAS